MDLTLMLLKDLSGLKNKPKRGDDAKAIYAKLNSGVRQGKIDDLMTFLPGKVQPLPRKKSKIKNMALGFVPNFSPLTSSISREMSAGIPASKIRVGSSPALRSSGNPSGLGVYNTIDEPRGLNQGISRSRSMGINPKSHGVPNFAGPVLPGQAAVARATTTVDVFGQEMKGAAQEAKSMKFAMAGMAAQMLAGAASANMPEGLGRDAVSGLGSVAGYAGLGASMGGVPGAIAGGAVGVVGFGLDYLSKHTDEAQNSVAALSKKLEEVSRNALLVSQSMDKITEKLNELPAEQDEVKRTGIVQSIVSEMVNAISNVSDKGIRDSLQKKFEQVDLTSVSVKELKNLQKEINENASSQQSRLGVELMGTNMRSQGLGVDFLSNRYNKGNYGQLASGFGLDISTLIDKTTGFLNTISLGNYFHPEGFPSLADKENKKMDIMNQLNARQYGPQFAQDLVNMQGKGGVPIGQLMMADKETRTNLGDLEKRFKDDPSPKSPVAVNAFEEGGVISKGLKTAGVSKELRNLIRKALNSPEARNIVLRSLFGMEMDAVETAFTDYMKDIPAAEANPGAKFSSRQRALLNQPIGAAPATPPPVVKRGNTGITELQDLVNSARENALTTKMSADEIRRSSVHNQRLRSISNRVNIAKAGVGMGNQLSVADATKKFAIEEAGIGFNERMDEAMGVFTSSIVGGLEKMGKEFQAFAADKKLLEGTLFDPATENLRVGGKQITTKEESKGMSQSEFAMAVYKSITEGGIDRQVLQDDINEATKRQAQGTGTLGVRDQVLLNFGPKMIDNINDAAAKYNETLKKEEDLRVKAIIAAKAQNKATKEYIELSGRYKRGEELRGQRLALSRSTERLGFIDQDLASGRITGSQAAELKRSNIRNSRDYMGLTEENTRTTAFRDEFLYGGRQALEEFEEGQRSVARSMKSSFAEAFQSISSGATTVQGALANMAQSILSSINQMSTQIFTNMMFSKMFGGNSQGDFAKGGYVPGYATGGLVTGGSGHKDDVLTRMQGGEFVIKKSAVNKIGVSNLNAINGYANGGSTGPSMGRMGAIAAVSGAATGILGAMMQDRPDKPLPSRNYGKGRGSLGYLGGADPDSGQIDRASGGGTSANVSLSKGFVYYRRDPKTGQLISERARPTEGRFEVSNALSLMGRLDENDSRTSRMFDKEQSLAEYQKSVAGEKASRRAQIRAVKDQKKSRLIGAYMNAAMLIGGAKLSQHLNKPTGAEGGGIPQYIQNPNLVGPRRADGSFANGGLNSGSLARVMGGEYVMSPETVRTHGVGFMTELNRGNLPKYASGGLVGNQTGGVASDGSGAGTAGNMTNNVSINVNIDKSGKAEASASVGSEDNSESSREESEDVQNNTGLGKALQSVVLDEIVKQQRPGGLLYTQN
jgi:lambda family phage tail tape measure protein